MAALPIAYITSIHHDERDVKAGKRKGAYRPRDEPPGEPNASIAPKPNTRLAGIGRRSPERSGGGSIELLGGAEGQIYAEGVLAGWSEQAATWRRETGDDAYDNKEHS